MTLAASTPMADDARSREGDRGGSEPSDWQYVQATLAGDHESYRRLIERHQNEIAAYMWRFTRDRRQWEELVQDVFVEAYLSLRSYRGTGPLLHWLRQIATRIGYRFWRDRATRRARTPRAVQPWDCLTDDDTESAHDAAETVHAVLTQLSPRDRLVLTLMYLEQASIKEIAQLTGWSVTMVKVQAHRARGRLKRLLEPTGEEGQR